MKGSGETTDIIWGRLVWGRFEDKSKYYRLQRGRRWPMSEQGTQGFKEPPYHQTLEWPPLSTVRRTTPDNNLFEVVK